VVSTLVVSIHSRSLPSNPGHTYSSQMKTPALLGRSTPLPPSLFTLFSFSRSCTSPLGSRSQASLALKLLGHAPLVSMALHLSCFCSPQRPFGFRIRRLLACTTVRPFQHFVLWRPAARCAPPYFDRRSFQLDTDFFYRSRFSVEQFYKFWILHHLSPPPSRGFFCGFVR